MSVVTVLPYMSLARMLTLKPVPTVAAFTEEMTTNPCMPAGLTAMLPLLPLTVPEVADRVRVAALSRVTLTVAEPLTRVTLDGLTVWPLLAERVTVPS